MKKDKLIGKTKEQAAEILRNATYRIIKEDGEDFIVTMDMVAHRYNLIIEKGIVTDVTFG